MYFYELASRLSHIADLNVHVLIGLNRSSYTFDSRVRTLEWESRIRPGLLRYVLNEAITTSPAIMAGPWDIYHSTLYRRMPLVRARRTVATNHDCTQERFPELFPDAKRVLNAKRRLYERADAIMCVSESSRNDLVHFYGVDPSKTHIVYQGVPQLKRIPDQCREFLAVLRRPYLLFVGSRYAYKNFHALLSAYASGGFAKDYDLVAVGGGELSNAEKEQIDRLKISGCVLHWRYVSDAVLAEAYARAELFVSASLYEGFGLPPLEALSLGCPVLASDSASVPEICGEAALYFNPGREGDLERGIRHALNAPDREQRKALGFATASRYSWQKNAEETLKVYRSV